VVGHFRPLGVVSPHRPLCFSRLLAHQNRPQGAIPPTLRTTALKDVLLIKHLHFAQYLTKCAVKSGMQKRQNMQYKISATSSKHHTT